VRKFSYLVFFGAVAIAFSGNIPIAAGCYLLGGLAFLISERQYPLGPSYLRRLRWVLLVWLLWPAVAALRWKQTRSYLRRIGRWAVYSGSGELKNFHGWEDACTFAREVAAQKSELNLVCIIDYARPAVVGGQRSYFTLLVERDGSMDPATRESAAEMILRSGP